MNEETEATEDETPREESANAVLQGCIFDLLRERRKFADNPDLLSYVDNKIAKLHQAQQDLHDYAALKAALKIALT